LDFSGQHFDIEFVNIAAEENCVTPTIEFAFERLSRAIPTQTEEDYIVVNLNTQLSIKRNEYSIIKIGHGRPKSLQQTWSTKPPGRSDIIFGISLDVVLTHIGNKFTYRLGLHFCEEVYIL
jgi:hypothetical protein